MMSALPEDVPESPSRRSSAERSLDPLTIRNRSLPSSPLKVGAVKGQQPEPAVRLSTSSQQLQENVPPLGSLVPAYRLGTAPKDGRRMPHGSRFRPAGTLPLAGAPPPSNQSTYRADPRIRRNSDSSTLTDFTAEPITTEELQMIEAKRRKDKLRQEEERRKAQSSDDPAKTEVDTKRPRRTDRRVDIIDQLDHTSVFGIVHHDGPFDALLPLRNRKGSSRAPMGAFPEDSLNNVLGGAAPNHPKHADVATFTGTTKDAEAFTEFASGVSKPDSTFRDASRGQLPVFDPTSRGSIVHGDETIGLGTSTFLEGTPAARTVIERTEAEKAMEEEMQSLQRKRSLAQRIRHIKKGGHYGPDGRNYLHDGVPVVRSPSILGPATSPPTLLGEPNPFFASSKSKEPNVTEDNESFDADDSANPAQNQPEQSRTSRGSDQRVMADMPLTSPTSPFSEDKLAKNSTGGGTGILARVRSLKGSGKARASDPQPMPLSQPQTQSQTQSLQPPGSVL